MTDAERRQSCSRTEESEQLLGFTTFVGKEPNAFGRKMIMVLVGVALMVVFFVGYDRFLSHVSRSDLVSGVAWLSAAPAMRVHFEQGRLVHSMPLARELRVRSALEALSSRSWFQGSGNHEQPLKNLALALSGNAEPKHWNEIALLVDDAALLELTGESKWRLTLRTTRNGNSRAIIKKLEAIATRGDPLSGNYPSSDFFHWYAAGVVVRRVAAGVEIEQR
jgi:hypothetical protein